MDGGRRSGVAGRLWWRLNGRSSTAAGRPCGPTSRTPPRGRWRSERHSLCTAGRRYGPGNDFLTETTTTHEVPASADPGEMHEGGDRGLIEAWMAALTTGDWSGIVSGLEESLISHAVVFAAEEARRRNAVVPVKPFM